MCIYIVCVLREAMYLKGNWCGEDMGRIEKKEKERGKCLNYILIKK